jgi:hypothetical protein
MLDFVDLALWAAGAVIAMGLIQWLKSTVNSIMKVDPPSWIWSAMLPAGAFAAAVSSGGPKMVWNALGIWAIAQLFWDAILRQLTKKIAGVDTPVAPAGDGK